MVMLIKSSGLGEGEVDLGEILIRGFLGVVAQRDTKPARMIFLNSGIFLTTEGSSVESILKSIKKSGTEILSCGTCLDYYGRKDKIVVGSSTDMNVTVDTIMNFEKVITL
jgi:selenium metabolism protein YedF